MISRVPAVNVSESKDHYHVELAAPGLKKEDFKLSLERDVLSISVEQTSKNESQERNFNKREFSYNSFVRSFTLPDSADENGIYSLPESLFKSALAAPGVQMEFADAIATKWFDPIVENRNHAALRLFNCW